MSKRRRTFIDSAILIAAWRTDLSYSRAAALVLDDPEREYISSPFVRLEIIPKAIFYRNLDEVAYYNDFFEAVDFWVEASSELIEAAHKVGCDFGLNALDALHVAAALSVHADEFITAERATSPLSRVRGLQITSIYPSR